MDILRITKFILKHYNNNNNNKNGKMTPLTVKK